MVTQERTPVSPEALAAALRDYDLQFTGEPTVKLSTAAYLAAQLAAAREAGKREGLEEAAQMVERLTKERDEAIRGQEFAEDLFNKNVGAHVAALDRADALATRVGLDVAAASNAGKREALKEIAKATQEVLAGAKNLDELRIAMKIAAAIRAKLEGV